jgi:hypothetical protein
MAHTYGSFLNVKFGKFFLLLSSLLAATFYVGAAAATDYDLGLHTYPNPFLAGYRYDGRDYATVAFEIPSGGTASVYVYDFDGNLIRTLLEGERYSPGKGEIEWDGRDDKNELVAPGPYVIVLELDILGELYRDTFVAVAHR